MERSSKIEQTATKGKGWYSILMVQVPGDARRRAGILLVDEQDMAYVRLSDRLFSADVDTLEIWSCLADDFELIAQEHGGRALLAELEDRASNFLSVETTSECEISDPRSDLETLYRNLVLAPGSSARGDRFAELHVPCFQAADIIEARYQLPSSPAASLKILRELKSRDADIFKIEQFLMGEPALAAQVIRFSNLAGHSRGEIRSVRNALIHVGTSSALSYLTAIVLRPLFASPALRRIWNESVNCSQAAAGLGTLSHGKTDEDADLLGLISNIGKIVLFGLKDYEKAYLQVRQLGYDAVNTELILSGTTHAEIGAEMLADWSFPEDMVEAVRYHHKPSHTDSRQASLLFLAESWVGSADEMYDSDEHEFAMEKLSLKTKDLASAMRKPKIATSATRY